MKLSKFVIPKLGPSTYSLQTKKSDRGPESHLYPSPQGRFITSSPKNDIHVNAK